MTLTIKNKSNMMANKIKKQFRLLSIELENFQSFTDPVKIDFSPITLFYGPNSAGKSAVFDAIELMKLIWDPNKANSNLIINHLDKWAHKPKSGSNAQRKTRVAISIHHNYKVNNLNFLESGKYRFIEQFTELAEPYLKFEFEAFYNERQVDGYSQSEWQIDKFSVQVIDDVGNLFPVIEMSKSLPNGLSLSDPVFLELNDSRAFELADKDEAVTLIHLIPGLYNENEIDYIFGSETISSNYLNASISTRFANVENKFYFGRHAFNGCSIFNISLWHYDDQDDDKAKAFKDLFLDTLTLHGRALMSVLNSAFPLVDADRKIPLPEDTIRMNNGLHFNDQLILNKDDSFISKSVSKKLSNEDYFFSELSKLAHVNKISQSISTLNPNSIELKGRLDPNSDEMIEFSRVNRYLSEYIFIDKGYQIASELNFIIPIEAVVNNPKSADLVNYPAVVSLHLIDADGRKLEIQDVGSGIAFVLPVLVSISTHQISTIQQPELHLHPALQSSLADIFLDRLNDSTDFNENHETADPSNVTLSSKDYWQTIVETHSEHILLRLLRRIRNTEQGKSNPDNEISPDELAIYYFNPLPKGSTEVRRMNVTPLGDFKDIWPDGFFGERDEDLFS